MSDRTTTILGKEHGLGQSLFLPFFVKANYSALFYSISLTRHSASSLGGHTDAYAVDEFGQNRRFTAVLDKTIRKKMIFLLLVLSLWAHYIGSGNI